MTETDESLWARVKGRWVAAARAAGRVQAAILLTLVYFLVIGPAWLLTRLFGADPLSRRRAASTGWVPSPPRPAREAAR